MGEAAGNGIERNSALAMEMKNALLRKGLHPSDEWLSNFLSSQRPTMRSQSLASTASFRLLASNIMTTLSKPGTATFPGDIQNATVRERRLPVGDLVVQILDIEDVGRSRWEQVEALEAIERGEGTKGRELIRLERADDGDDEQPAAMRSSSTIASDLQKSKGPHKVLMQDIDGKVAYGIELTKVEGLTLNMNIGAKVLLHGPLVARGVVLLEPTTATLLGGKIDSLHQTWNRSRKERLRDGIERQSTNGQ